MKFETIDDKYLYENIKRFEFNALNINDAVCKHRKFWLISFFIYFANFLLFLSISIFSHGSINSFFANHINATGFKAVFNIFYFFMILSFIALILFLLSFSSLYSKFISKFEVKKFFKSFKKINSDDFVHDLEFEDNYREYSFKTIPVNTFYKYDFPYDMLIDYNSGKFVFVIANNIYSKVFNINNVDSVYIECDDKIFKQEDLKNDNGYYKLVELFDLENGEELDFVRSLKNLKINIVMKDLNEFSLVFINEQLKSKKMLKEYSVVGSLREIYNILV